MNRSATALARSYRGERAFATSLGLLALLAGAGAVLLGTGVLGAFRAARPVLDPIAVQRLVDWPTTSRIAAIAAGLLLVVLGLLLFVRTLRPERHPDLALDDTVGRGLTVTAGAIAEAVGLDAEQVDGVSRARATMVGTPESPALRLSLWLREGSSVKAVWAELDGTVLRRARESLGVATLPTAVRLELGAAERQRVR